MSKTKYILYFTIMLVSVAILSYFIMAFSMRFIADDYCMSYFPEHYTVWEFLHWYYTSWSGQFSYPFVKTFTHNILGLNAPIIIPLVVYLMWWLGNIVLLSLIFHKWNWHDPGCLAFVLGSFHLFILLSTMASRQTMYWLDALLFHVLPLSLLVLIIIGWLLAIQSRRWQTIKIVAFFALLFVYGGFHMLPSLFGLAFWIVVMLVIWFFLPDALRSMFPVTFSAFLGNLVAFTVVLISPGNWQRLSVYEQTGVNVSFIDGSIIALGAAVRYWTSTISLLHFVLVISVMISICLIWDHRKGIPFDHPVVQTIRQYTWVIVGVSILIGIGYSQVSLLLPAISTGTTRTRVFVTAGLTMTMTSLWIGLVLGLRFMRHNLLKRMAPAVVVMALSLLILASVYRLYGNIVIHEEYVVWSQEWDTRHTALVNAATMGADVVEVAPFSHQLPKLLGPNPDAMYSFASCMQNYYGIPSLILNPDLIEETIRLIE